MNDPSIVDYRGKREGYRCGYCSHTDTKVAHGMWAHALTVQDYQDLINRGWRRSGKYTYKPAMGQTCCPQYAIRCEVRDFKMNKSHKKVIKRVNRYLSTGIKPGEAGGEANKEGSCQDNDESRGLEPQEIVPNHSGKVKNIACKPLSRPGTGAGKSPGKHSPKSDSCKKQERGDAKSGCDKNGADAVGAAAAAAAHCDNVSNRSEVKDKKTPKPGVGADPTRPPCKKAKLRRLEKRQQKETQSKPDKGKAVPTNEPEKKTESGQKSLESFLEDIAENPAHKLELRLVRSEPRSEQFYHTYQESYKVYKRYQMSIHGDPPDKPTEKQYTRFLVTSPLQMRLVRSNPPSEEFLSSFKEAYGVYKKYQMTIHKDTEYDCKKSSYESFLVDSPLEEQKSKREGGFPDGFGSFHQQYVLDGKIIAVGVLDILPHCVSSVYLYYDPDYAFLSLGTYSALREIAFVRHLQTMEPDIKYYYMGYYIHSCPKMRYKGQYHGSKLLCPETYLWYPMSLCGSLLDANKYSRFAETGKVDEDGKVDLKEVMILNQRQAMPYPIYRALNPDAGDQEEVKEYASFVGNKVSSRMLLYRS